MEIEQSKILLNMLKESLVEIRFLAGKLCDRDLNRINSTAIFSAPEKIYLLADAIHNLPENVLEVTDDVSIKQMIEKLSLIAPNKAKSASQTYSKLINLNND